MKKKYPRKCLQCKTKFDPPYPNSVVCSVACSIEYGKKIVVKETKKEAKDWNKEKRVRKEKLKSRTDWEADLQDEINKTARLIDRGWGCISCKGYTTPQAGHLHSRKANPAIRYNLHNLFVQDTACNQHKSGNELKYLDGINRLFGKEYMEYIQFDLVRLYPVLKLPIEVVKDKIKLVRAENKKLEKKEKYFTLQERIEMRDYYNDLYGMYEINYIRA
jgi:hypothetical protein